MAFGAPIDVSKFASKADLDAALTALANVTSTLAGKADTAAMTTALAAKAATSAIPQPATVMPPGVADDGAKGSAPRYALEDHTHAAKVRKSRPSVSTSTYVWTYPTPFATGVVPVVFGMAQTLGATADLFNVQAVGDPTNTQCTFQINRVSAGLLSLLLGALSLNPTPVALKLQLLALEP